MRYFLVSDVHSSLTPLKNELTQKGFNYQNNDKLVILGDLFDRGSEAVELLEFLYNLIKLNKLIFIRGNHDDRLFKILKSGKYDITDIMNGTVDTLNQFYNYYFNDNIGEFSFLLDFSTYIEKINQIDALKALKKIMINYYQIGKNILVHSFIPMVEKIDDLSNLIDSDFDDAIWDNPFDSYERLKSRLSGYTIIGGHYPCYYKSIDIEIPYKALGYININSDYFKTNKLYVMVIEEENK